MISALLRYWNSLEVSQVRKRCLPGRLMPHVPKGSAVLDVGSGNGYIASCMVQGGGAASVVGLDVLLHPNPLIPVIKFDGERLPYDDNAFDMVTLIDVLHHSDHPERLLKEAARVARHRVLVKDHYWVTRFDRWLLHFSDYLGNKPYNISLPYNFLHMDQWAALFDDLALTALSTEQFCYAPQDRSKQVIFVLAPIMADGGEGAEQAG
jgi:ubiquinone/menaquinone biosynthesis C-methylase UbiE